jgi:hypothetical protein
MDPIPLEPADAVTVTTLVDGVADLLLPDEGPATRLPLARARSGDVPARFLEPGSTGGWRGTHARAARFPDASIQNSVGSPFTCTA